MGKRPFVSRACFVYERGWEKRPFASRVCVVNERRWGKRPFASRACFVNERRWENGRLLPVFVLWMRGGGGTNFY